MWLSHAPPAGTATAWTRHGIDFGDHEFRSVCSAGIGPSIALCGHVHEPKAWHATVGRSLVLNPGFSSDSAVPNFNVLDLKRGVVRHRAGGVAIKIAS